MTLQDINLKPSTLKAVRNRARRLGQTAPQYVRSLIERAVAADRTFDDILAPVRAGFKKNGVSAEEMDELVATARKDIYARSHRQRRGGRTSK
jgi:hypothetical protein